MNFLKFDFSEELKNILKIIEKFLLFISKGFIKLSFPVRGKLFASYFYYKIKLIHINNYFVKINYYL